MTQEELREYNNRYYEKNKEKIRAYRAEYRKKNKEKIRAQKSEHRKRNAEYYKAYRADYYKKNKEELISKQAEYRKKQRHKPVVYLIVNENYVGITENLKHRMGQHKSKGRDVSFVRVLAEFDNREEALELEEFLHSEGYEGKHEFNLYR